MKINSAFKLYFKISDKLDTTLGTFNINFSFLMINGNALNMKFFFFIKLQNLWRMAQLGHKQMKFSYLWISLHLPLQQQTLFLSLNLKSFGIILTFYNTFLTLTSLTSCSIFAFFWRVSISVSISLFLFNKEFLSSILSWIL